ncbi:hypothetical protein B0T24DRAFT_588115 [Lasiosphaeria ovina]|uniref:Uncharacterized protein n=1 Tax=Lasiosphaeria ovina TaxID=92902 RepID=A0AAE0NLA4_9PEZI|nr:hypothetical protein B0T24DRAFT_588115 [Lasiosphaeria ovina]
MPTERQGTRNRLGSHFLIPKYGMHPGLQYRKRFREDELAQFLKRKQELRDRPDLKVTEEKRAEAAENERRLHETLEKSRGTGTWPRDDDVLSIDPREYDNPVVRRQERNGEPFSGLLLNPDKRNVHASKHSVQDSTIGGGNRIWPNMEMVQEPEPLGYEYIQPPGSVQVEPSRKQPKEARPQPFPPMKSPSTGRPPQSANQFSSTASQRQAEKPKSPKRERRKSKTTPYIEPTPCDEDQRRSASGRSAREPSGAGPNIGTPKSPGSAARRTGTGRTSAGGREPYIEEPGNKPGAPVKSRTGSSDRAAYVERPPAGPPIGFERAVTEYKGQAGVNKRIRETEDQGPIIEEAESEVW